MKDKIVYNPDKLEQIKYEIFRSANSASSNFDTSLGLNKIISNLIKKSSLETGKPIYLQISVLSDDNPENKLCSTIFKQNFCILPIAYDFLNIPIDLFSYKMRQKELNDLVKNIASKNDPSKQKFLDTYEISNNLYNNLILNFCDDSKDFNKAINYSKKAIFNRFNNYAPERLELALDIINNAELLNNKKIQNFINNGSPEYALKKIKEWPVEKVNRNLDFYSNILTSTIIQMFARTYREYEIQYSKSANDAIKILCNLNIVNTMQPFKDQFNEAILNINDVTIDCDIDFVNICALAGKKYAYDNLSNNKKGGQKGE